MVAVRSVFFLLLDLIVDSRVAVVCFFPSAFISNRNFLMGMSFVWFQERKHEIHIMVANDHSCCGEWRAMNPLAKVYEIKNKQKNDDDDDDDDQRLQISAIALSERFEDELIKHKQKRWSHLAELFIKWQILLFQFKQFRPLEFVKYWHSNWFLSACQNRISKCVNKNGSKPKCCHAFSVRWPFAWAKFNFLK